MTLHKFKNPAGAPGRAFETRDSTTMEVFTSMTDSAAGVTTARFSLYRSTGKERDAESGNDYFGARYYASSMGRFMSPDPGWFMAINPANPQSLNLYSYALNNPLRFIDPSGMVLCDYGSSDNGGEDYEDADDEKECISNGGTLPTDQTTITVNADGSNGQCAGDCPAPPSITSLIGQSLCAAVPSGRITGVSASAGGVGSATGGGEAVFNYNSGQTSLFGYGGLQGGWNGGLSGSIYTGAAYGLTDDNSNYSGGFTGVNGGALLGGFVSRSSGGLTNGPGGIPPAPIGTSGAVTTAGVSTGLSTTVASGNISVTNYTNPLQVGQFSGWSLPDLGAYAAKQVCKALGY